MSSQDAQNSKEMDNVCVVCFKTVEIFSIGTCDHAVCFECSTRMRILCKQNECPICRTDLPKVLFTKKIEPFSVMFERFERSNLQDRKFGIIFCTYEIQKAYFMLLEHRCQVCDQSEHRWPFKTFQQLKDHMRREHELFYCDICSENLKIFSFERRCYTRSDLALHRRKGDKNNTSHRGHPLCEFCDTRFMDNDDLFRHLRRNHLFCHLCDADGKHQYYNSMDDLKRHFGDEHYLCKEGECKNMPLTAVFRSDIDLKAHITQEHSRFMSKSANKQARTLELEFTLAPRPRSDNNRNKRPQERRDRFEEDAAYNVEPGGGAVAFESQPRMFVNPLTSDQFPALGGSAMTTSSVAMPSKNFTKISSAAFNSDDFPSLGGPSGRTAAPAVTITANAGRTGSAAPEVTITRTVRNQQNGQKMKEKFPALSKPSSGGSTVRLSVNSNNQKQPPKVSIQVNQKPNGSITTHITTTAPSTSQSTEAFPVLGKGGASAQPSQPKWVQTKPKKAAEPPKAAKVAPCPVLKPSDPNSFPSLSKTSSVTVPVDSWVNLNSIKNVGKKKGPNKAAKKVVQAHNASLDSKLESLKFVDASAEEGGQKGKKKKSKSEEDAKETDINENVDNGAAKRRSELKIGNLSSLEVAPPPGFSVRPPPGFGNANFPALGSVSNDLTFTNSTGQSYSITPTAKATFKQPQNFQNRNRNIIQSLMDVLKDNEAINEFKSLSDQFRSGNVSAKAYRDRCAAILGPKFDEVFPELLALLPDIDRQRALFAVLEDKSKRGLVGCENCGQVVFRRELSEHYNYHRLDNHFPTLGAAQPIHSAWKK